VNKTQARKNRKEEIVINYFFLSRRMLKDELK